MSENKKPENLLAEILYSRKRVQASYYKDGKFTHGDEHASLKVRHLPCDSLQRRVRGLLAEFIGKFHDL